MKTSAAGRKLIKDFESLSLTAYVCPAGKLTIGYGHTGPDVTDGQVITAAQAESILKTDLAKFEGAVTSMCPETTQSQFDAMVCLAFNIGGANFKKSSVARLHNSKDYTGAARAFSLWNKATNADGKKVELRGLTRRRAAEAALYLTDDGIEEPQRTRAADVVPEKPLTVSKTMIGSGVAAASTASSWLSDLDYLKTQLTDLAPYLPSISNALLVIGLIGIGVAMYARWKDKKEGHG